MITKRLSSGLCSAVEFAIIGLLLWVAGPALGQQQAQKDVPLERVLNPPASGTFYLVQRKDVPPLPFDPFFGQLPVYQVKPGSYVVDDSKVDYVAWNAQKAALPSESSSGGSLELMSGGGGGPDSFGAGYSYAPTNLWLEITRVTNNQAFFVIHTPDALDNYDLFSTTNLALTTNVGGLNRTNWMWLMRSAVNQTNLVLTNLWPSQGWFQLGTMLDSDSDGLPDAFEIFTSKTNPNLRDSDSDGLDDGEEMGPNGLPWRLEQERRNGAVVYATIPTATEGGGCGQFTVYLPTPAPAGGAMVQYRFGGNTGVGTDFTTTPAGNTLTFSAGASSAVITVCAVNDSAFADLDRYVEVTLTNASCCAVDSQPARITLVDNDPPEVRVFALPPWVRKPSPTFGTNAASFYFIRDGDSLGALTVGLSLGGTGQSGVDYLALPSSIFFPANVRTNLLPVILKPTTNITDKTLSVTLTSVPGYQIDPAAGVAVMTIASTTVSLPTVQVTATDDDAREAGLNPGTFTFTRTGSTAGPLRVFYRVSGNATTGSSNSERDYVALPGYVDFAAGMASKNVTVTPLQDGLSETVETVLVTLATGDYRVGASSAATVYIDDNGSVRFVEVLLRNGIKGATFRQPSRFRITRYGTALAGATMNWRMSYGFTPNIFSSAQISGHGSGSQVIWNPRQAVAEVQFTTFWTTYADTPASTSLTLSNAYENRTIPTVTYYPPGHYVTVTSSGGAATTVSEGTTVAGGLIFRRPYANANAFTLYYSIEGSADHGVGNDYSVLTAFAGYVPFGPGVNQVNVNVQAYANAQTNGWKTGVITLDKNTAQVGDALLDRAFIRIQDAQVSNPVPDTDLDGDGLSDGWELAHPASNDPLTPDDPYADPDHDGLGAVEEMQLGTNPSVADGQPAYPSEDPDDYVSLTLLLGAGGKLADKTSCASCHQVGVRAGSHLRYSPATSWEQSGNVDPVVRFLRGTNYPVRLLDNPYSKVLPSSETNTTFQKYTAAYTAQFLTGPAGPAYALITDTNQLFGTNKPMVLEALGKAATLYVPDLIIAADVDRDGTVSTSNRNDRTSANNPLVFWINDDSDLGSDDTAEDRDPAQYVLNSSNTSIDGLRDLEDFTRLHFRVEGLPGNLLTNAGLQTRIYLTNLSGTPSLRLFRAVETNGGAAYLTNENTAVYQLALGPHGVVAGGTPLTLAGSEWKSAGSNRFFLPTIFEGISTGRCVVVFAIASNAGPNVAISRPFYLDLRRATDLYEHWTVGDNTTTTWDQVPGRATHVADSAAFGAPQRGEELDYILFVHGWRMLPWERRAFASTAYKRLWHLNYKGRFGLFSWPTDWVENPVNLTELQNYDRSERRAWHSASGLERKLIDLNRNHLDRVRVMAHSMGNIVVSEALHLHGSEPSRPPILHSYAASQAASVAHAYDEVNPETTQTDATTQTPEVYARYSITGLPYFTGMTNAVRFDGIRNIRSIWNFHNQQDFALGTLSWDLNQNTKPDDGWGINPISKKWRRYPQNPDGGSAVLTFPRNTYEMYAHIAEARSYALGAAERDGFSVRGQIGDQVDLNGPPFLYRAGQHEHSAQFRSIIMRRNSYWSQLLSTFEIVQ